MNLVISFEKKDMNLKVVHQFLTNSYWAKGRSIADVKKSIENSFCVVALVDNQMVAFARVVTDFTIFAYLMDVFVLDEFRGLGISKKMLQELLEHPQLIPVKKWMLATRDANGLYEKFDFHRLADPEIFMEKKLC